MAELELEPVWHDHITQIQTTHKVLAGPNGIWNLPQKELGDRTEWLYAQVLAAASLVDEINGEIITPSLKAKLDHLQECINALIQALRDKGVNVPSDASLGEIVEIVQGLESIGGGATHDVTNVTNNPTYNPGTHVGGIQWTDPSTDPEDIECIEIFDLCGEEPVSMAEISLGVQRWEPEIGTHQYHIRVKFTDGTYSPGVVLPQNTYSISYTVNLLTAIVPLTDPSMLILSFDNYVKLTNAAGFTVNGIDDGLVYLDKIDDKTVRLRLATKCFVHGATNTLSYDPAIGSLLQNNDSPVDAINSHSIQNYSDYAPGAYHAAEIPQALPNTLVVVMSRSVKNVDYTKFSLTGTTAAISGVISPVGNAVASTIEFILDEPVDAGETAIRLSMAAGGMVDNTGQAVAPFANAIVINNSTHLSIGVLSAEIPSSDPNMVQVVMDGSVTINGATSGSGAPTGWELIIANQGFVPGIESWEISDGTVWLHLDDNVLEGKLPHIEYDGTGGLRAVSNNDTVSAFAIAITNYSTYSTQPMGDLPVDAKVKFETFRGNHLKWLVKGKNHPDYSPGATTIVTENVIALLCADAKEPNNSDVERKNNGNNRYIYLNLCKWMNSAAPAGEWYSPAHPADAPPIVANIMSEPFIPYVEWPGFLNEFSAKGLDALMDTTLTVGRVAVDGGGTETCVQKIFLLSATEVGLTSDFTYGTKLEGFTDNASRIARIDADCPAENDPNSDFLATFAVGKPWYYYLRDPYTMSKSGLRTVTDNGTLSIYGGVSRGSYGIRLTSNLHSSTLVSAGPDDEGYYNLI